MKSASFLNKLYLEGKLREIEPSEEVKDAYLQKSMKSLSSAKLLLDAGNLEDSVAMAYYAMYHCFLALLYRIGIKCENHAAAIILLKSVFNIDNSKNMKAKSERIDKQYYISFSISKEETKDSIILAEGFIANSKDFIDKMNNDKINEYLNLAITMIKQ